METYANVLLIALPSFMVLILIEILYGYRKKNLNYNLMDTISSLSAGATNIIKSLLGIGFAIISYPYIVAAIALVQLEESMGLYLIAFVCIDLASYWNHRLNHSINIFWNRHVVHHSSEEFNLACALRQSISNNIIGFGALFLIPAALFGVPSKIIILLAPLHLFAQFWYHTQHIGKLGWLEYVFVTPSQHRVHHAINEEYVDKNLSAIFCVWDRIFGTFQEELDEETPVYGVLKPVNTWNPIVINFQHAFNVIQDAYNTNSLKDKLKIWFMPTGWRPADVIEKFPRPITENPKERPKYSPNYSTFLKGMAFYHFISINLLLTFFLYNFSDLSNDFKLIFGSIIVLSIFGFTSLMDFHSWAIKFEIFRSVVSIAILSLLLNNQFLINDYSIPYFLMIMYFSSSFIFALFLLKNKSNLFNYSV